MGHLVNSNTLRVGWFYNWSDSWYVKSAYYPEFLHLILRIKFFLSYVLNSKIFETNGFLYSHFTISSQYNSFFVNIFFYDGFVENWIHIFLSNHKKLVKSGKFRKHKRPKFSAYKPWRLLLVLNWLHQFKLSDWPKHNILFMIKSMHYMHRVNIIDSLTNRRILKHLRGSGTRFYFFYILFHQVKYAIAKTYLKNYVNDRIAFSRFLYVLAWSNWNRNLFIHLRNYFSFLLSYFLDYNYFNVSFYALNSYSVNAKFLSRFIAKKLKQSYSIFEVLGPIKRELYSTVRLSRFPLSNFFYEIYKGKITKTYVNSFKIGAIRMLLTIYWALTINIVHYFLKNIILENALILLV